MSFPESGRRAVLGGLSHSLLGCFALALAAACVTRAPSPSLGPGRQRDLLARDEIITSVHEELDLYQVIRSLRPHFLTVPSGVRPAGATRAIAVYVDGLRQSGLVSLRSILAANVEEVRYLDPVAAQNEFGPIASAGAVLVTLYRPPPPP